MYKICKTPKSEARQKEFEDTLLRMLKKQKMKEITIVSLFGSRDSNRISATAVHRLVKKYLLIAGLDADALSAHKLRHTAATMMLSGGVDVKTVQEVLGIDL